MRKSVLAIFAIALLSPAAVVQSQLSKSNQREGFLVDQAKPYVYLQVDRIGPRIARNEDEPSTGIWLHLHNNCKVPIIVRTFGVPPDSPKGEIGVLDNVVPNPKQLMGDGAVSYGVPMTGPPPSVLFGKQGEPELKASPSAAEPPAAMPYGYMFPTSSFTTLAPGQSVYFSLPTNQVSDGWHVEIPFRFALKVTSPVRAASNFVSLYKRTCHRQLKALSRTKQPTRPHLAGKLWPYCI